MKPTVPIVRGIIAEEVEVYSPKKHGAICRKQLIKELMPGLEALFGIQYQKYNEENSDAEELP